MFAIIQAAGWPIWPLLIASIIGLALIIERLVYLRRARILPDNLLAEVVRVYQQGRLNDDVIDKLEQNSPLGQVLAAGLRNLDAPREVMKEAIEESGQAAAHRLERYLTTLGTIASLAPLMGLFGTVIGMIEIFGSHWCFIVISGRWWTVLWWSWSSRRSALSMWCMARATNSPQE